MVRIRCNGMQFSKDGHMHACVIRTKLQSSNLHRRLFAKFEPPETIISQYAVAKSIVKYNTFEGGDTDGTPRGHCLANSYRCLFFFCPIKFKFSRKNQQAKMMRNSCKGMQFSKDGSMHACLISTKLLSSNLHRRLYLNMLLRTVL